MLQNGGCNKKSTLLDLKDGGNIARIEVTFAYKMYPSFTIFCSVTLRKKKHVHIFQDC